MPTVKLLNVSWPVSRDADRLNEVSLRKLNQRISLRCQLRRWIYRDRRLLAGRIRMCGRPEQIFTRESIGAVFASAKDCLERGSGLR